MINVYTVTVSDMATNCYIIVDEVSGDCAVVDPGELNRLLDMKLAEIGYDKIMYILLTHGHYDHIGGVEKLLAKTAHKAEVVISEKELPLLSDSLLNLSRYFTEAPLAEIKADVPVHDGDKLTLGESIINVLETPGHTSGSVCYLCDDKLFSGDTLFYRSMGRTDFPTGDQSEMFSSLARLAKLDENISVYPGHGSESTIGSERKNNPYIR